MENTNNNLSKMDLSVIPADITSIIGKYLLMGNNDKFKFIKYLEKRTIMIL